MIILLAGIFTSSFQKNGNIYRNKLLAEEQKVHDYAVTTILESYHYTKSQSMVDKIRQSGFKIFLDSGAYSAFTKGITVNLSEYAEYIKRNSDIIAKVDGVTCASVLDVIGNADETYRNQKELERLGVTPLPCFHYGEHPDVVEYYLQNYPYITIGGMVPIPNPKLRIWLDWLWDKHLTDENGKPRAKVHGFGLTTIDLISKYPWYSVDSTVWVQFAANGNLLWGPHGKAFPISEHSPQVKMRGAHYDNLSELDRAAVNKTLIEKGFSIERLRELYYVRWLYNCKYLKDTVNALKDKSLTFTSKQPGLFNV